MSDTVSWVLELAVKPGELDNFKALMGEMVADTQSTQPGTTHYEWFFSDDGSACHLYERYKDSAATLIHLTAFAEKFAERFLASVEPTRLTVYGSPNDEVRGILSGFGATFMGQLGGYAR